MSPARAKDWLSQADNDFAFAKIALESGYYSQCCFICQQAGEKALKAVLMKRGAKVVFSHSLFQLCQQLGFNGRLEAAAKKLDTYYTTTRYPDTLPGGAPFEMFSETDARDAIAMVESIVIAAKQELA